MLEETLRGLQEGEDKMEGGRMGEVENRPPSVVFCVEGGVCVCAGGGRALDVVAVLLLLCGASDSLCFRLFCKGFKTGAHYRCDENSHEFAFFFFPL